MDPFKDRASRQLGLFARWQLIADGVPEWTVDWHATALRAVFPGVFVTGWAPVTAEQHRWAGTLTAPWTVLSHEAACSSWGLLSRLDGPVTVTRPGSTGIRRYEGLEVHYSRTLRGNVTTVDGFFITTPERTVIDCWPRLPPRQRQKMLREALRTSRTTIPRLERILAGHPRRRGVGQISKLLRRWSALPFDRCRSDAEAYALTVFAKHRIPIPRVNTHVAGEEADLFWPDRRWILELDGPQWHRFKEEDARKTAVWVAAGHVVRRLPTGTVFADEVALMDATPPRGR